MEKYALFSIQTSIETHLFFSRIMKEHGLFLEAGFVCADTEWVKKADWFRRQFEDLLRDTVEISNGRVSRKILGSGELVTEFTIPAERCTEDREILESDYDGACSVHKRTFRPVRG